MKINKIVKISFSIVLTLLLLTTFTFASYDNVTMSVVSEPVCTIDITEKSGFEKKLISKDLSNKQITMQLSVSNNETETKPTGEIILVLDNSKSMIDDKVEGTEISRADLVNQSAKSLVSKLLTDNTQLKIGIVRFSTNTDITKEGTIDDASVVSGLSNDSQALSNAIDTIPFEGPRTDLEAGLTLAKNQFSSDAINKYMILLTDGGPNVCLNFDKQYYSDTVFAQSKAKLEDIEDSNISLISVLTGITSAKRDISPAPMYTSKTYSEIIELVFGSEENPTAGTFYDIQDKDLEKTITETIYNSLITESKSIKDISILDYFPSEIVNNFDFELIKQPEYGTVSSTINTTNNSITWTIPELPAGKTSTVQYTLTLKKNYSSSIVDKILKTNTKVDLSYTDFDEETQSKTSDVSPTIKLTEPTQILPKAGTPFMFAGIILLGGFSIFTLIRYTKLRKEIK